MTTLAASVADTLLNQFLSFAQLCVVRSLHSPPWPRSKGAAVIEGQVDVFVLWCRTEVMLLKMPPMRKRCRGCRCATCDDWELWLVSWGPRFMQRALLRPSHMGVSIGKSSSLKGVAPAC